jgi:hypothetical protein
MICGHINHTFNGMMAEATHVSCRSGAPYCARHACPRCKPIPAPPADAPVSAATEPPDPAPSAPPDPRDARIAELEATVRNQRRELNALNATERRTGGVGQSRPISQDALRLRELEAERDRLRAGLQLAKELIVELIDIGRVHFTRGPRTKHWDEGLATVRAALKGTET